MMDLAERDLESLKLEIKIKAKNGIDFIFAASIVWFGIFLIWRFIGNPAYEKSIFTFIWGAVLIPLALLFSKLFRTEWKIPANPLQSLGLWLNFAQLIYFPFLVFILVRYPDYFIMAYAIITGAHLFPYAWFYDDYTYAIIAVVISVGALLMALMLDVTMIYYIPLFTFSALLVLGLTLTKRYNTVNSRL